MPLLPNLRETCRSTWCKVAPGIILTKYLPPYGFCWIISIVTTTELREMDATAALFTSLGNKYHGLFPWTIDFWVFKMSQQAHEEMPTVCCIEDEGMACHSSEGALPVHNLLPQKSHRRRLQKLVLLQANNEYQHSKEKVIAKYVNAVHCLSESLHVGSYIAHCKQNIDAKAFSTRIKASGLRICTNVYLMQTSSVST